MFEGLVKQLKTQKAEADKLRSTASMAVKAAICAEDRASSELRSCFAEERAQSSRERENLLCQITELVYSNGRAAEDRWHSKLNAVCNELSGTTSALHVANSGYNDGMDMWLQAEHAVIDEVSRSRDALKAKMKNDWTVSSRFSHPKHKLTCFSSRLLTNTIPQSKQPPRPYTKKLFASSTLR